MRVKLVVAVTLILASVTPGVAQQIVTTRDLNVRTAPSANAHPIRLVEKGGFLTLVGPDTLENGFFHVRTETGEVGWLPGHFTKRVEPQPPDLAGDPVPPPNSVLGLDHPAAAISQSWTKPPVQSSTFISSDANGQFTCGPLGSPKNAGEEVDDPGTNRLKNRVDVPVQYHAVAFSAIGDTTALRWPHDASTTRRVWTPEELSLITPFEGAAITVTGFIRVIKPQSSSGESANCYHHGAPNTDWHVALVEHLADPESTAVVVEVTPRFKQIHGDAWTTSRLSGYAPPLDATDSVRVSGFLMFDPVHKGHLGRFRKTLWEIHPVTRIEVFEDGQWQDLAAGDDGG